ncbi:MAG: metallophosphoesterase [Pirellulaceae bacterium]|nr:metallophosphoesterase [Pirellulaceae bacterium]
MLFAVLTYNFMLIGLDFIALLLIAKQRSWIGCFCTLAGHLLALLALAVFMVGPSFAGLNLVSYGLFLHLPLVWIGASMIFFSRNRFLSGFTCCAGLLVVGIGVDAFLIEPQWLEITHQKVKSPKLDAPIRIAVVADLQTDRLGAYERNVFQKLAAESPDMILFAGDYLQAGQDSWFGLAKQYESFFEEIDLSAPLGVFAVGGNTDHPRWREIFSRVSATASAKTQATRSSDCQITQLSVADSFDTQLRVAGSDLYHIVLGHAPDFALGEVSADLLIAGHTHGGQVRIPFLGPIMTMSAVPRSWATGLTKIPHGGMLAVSRGIGMERGNAPRLRFLCRPQLMLLDLIPSQAGADEAR